MDIGEGRNGTYFYRSVWGDGYTIPRSVRYTLLRLEWNWERTGGTVKQ